MTNCFAHSHFDFSPSTGVTMATDTIDNNVDGSSDGLYGSGAATDLCTASYSGSACESYLNLCPDSKSVINSPSKDLVDDLDTLNNFYAFVTSGECTVQKDLVIGFLCQHTFQPCDDAGNVFRPSRSTCELIQEEICPGEVRELSVLYPSLVPNCSLLPNEPVTPSCKSLLGK